MKMSVYMHLTAIMLNNPTACMIMHRSLPLTVTAVLVLIQYEHVFAYVLKWKKQNINSIILL